MSHLPPHPSRGRAAFDGAVAGTPDACLLKDFSPEADALLIAFGGVSGKLGIPVFEFFNVISKLDVPVKRVYVRDLRNAWYHLGAPGLGDTIDDIAASLRSVVEEAGVRRVVTVGHSAGGYAAIIFGALLGAGRVLAFSPPMTLDPETRRRAGNMRALERLHALAESGGPDPRYAALRDVLVRGCHAQVEIHYSPRDPLVEIERVADLPCVRTFEHQHGGHNLVKLMRDDGSLARLLRDTLTDVPAAPRRRRRRRRRFLRVPFLRSAQQAAPG